MNNDAFLIENYDIELAQDICKTIENNDTRNRAVACVLGAKISEKYFTETEVDTKTGLHNIALVQERLEISDIYIKNNYIDVRVYFNDNELCVPKAHFDKETLPLAYMFIKLNEDLTGAMVTGFVMPSVIDTSVEYNGYYAVNEADLISYYDIEAMISEGFTYDIDDDILIPIFEYINGTIEDDGHFYRTLMASKEARQRLSETLSANHVYNYISQTKSTEPEEITENTAIDETIEENIVEEITPLEENTEILSLDTDEVIIENLDEDITDLQEVQELELSVDSEDEFDLVSNNTTLESFDTEENDLFDVEDNFEEVKEIISEESNDNLLDEQPIEPLEETDTLIQNETFVDDIETVEEFEQADLSEVSDLLADYEEETIDSDNETIDSSVENIEEDVLAAEEEDNNIVAEIDDSEESTGSFKYTTEVSPSINSYEEEIINDENEIQEPNVDENELLQLLDDETQATETTSEEKETTDEILEENSSNEEQIDVLFNENSDSSDEPEYENVSEPIEVLPVNNSSKLIPLIGILTVVAAVGYFTYTKVFNNTENTVVETNNAVSTQTKTIEKQAKLKEEAMPVETIENNNLPIQENEGTAESIPAIEDNLDASILISNLRVAWEVPVSYASNSTAKRYFTKLGKIIQLNLKTEMLLLSKPPITNKILVELEYNKSSQKFVVKGITVSSGEKVVDDLIQNTVKNSLDINLNMDLSSFGNIQGNPTLVINL